MELAPVIAGFMAGLAALVISPCAVAVIPAYAAYLVGSQGGSQPPKRIWPVAASTALGMVTPLLLLGMSAVLLGRVLVDWVPHLQLAAAFMVAVMGLLFISGRGHLLRVSTPGIGFTGDDWGPAFLLGVTFGLTIMGSSLPVTLSIVLAVVTSPILEAAAVMGAFGLGMVAVLLGMAALARGVREQLLKRIMKHVPLLEEIAGAGMLALAVYLVYFWSVTAY